MSKTLYICYFGVREPLVQTQVLPYLREIRKGGTDDSILTFEPEYGRPMKRPYVISLRKKASIGTRFPITNGIP